MEPRVISIARRMFKAYSDRAGGLTHDGKPIPTFDELGEAVQANWIAAAEVATADYDNYQAAIQAIAVAGGVPEGAHVATHVERLLNTNRLQVKRLSDASLRNARLREVLAGLGEPAEKVVAAIALLDGWTPGAAPSMLEKQL